MDKIEIDGVDILNPIENKMDKIVDAFVKFYGEEYRSRIEEKLNNAKIYFVASHKGFGSLDKTIERYYDDKLTEVENSFWKEVEGGNIERRNKKNVIYTPSRF